MNLHTARITVFILLSLGIFLPACGEDDTSELRFPRSPSSPIQLVSSLTENETAALCTEIDAITDPTLTFEPCLANLMQRVRSENIECDLVDIASACRNVESGGSLCNSNTDWMSSCEMTANDLTDCIVDSMSFIDASLLADACNLNVLEIWEVPESTTCTEQEELCPIE